MCLVSFTVRHPRSFDQSKNSSDTDPTIFQTKEDLEIIRKLIMDYISDPRTIIL